ncbi:hypothetical protein OGAPHI_000435 [Ogataea philodendri]|uniref:Uncharacterized protein n=1 Tax=Ogataea philodendri TaxID=1378263 RepID=A0A9P8PHH8_9ASCO|nr:uncharacterized protein OGAPHI_000435 [Ogataea philodendri]KAH3671730.1 hypothetical protein OGAPHI_000435 [Ogataea philodendri]
MECSGSLARWPPTCRAPLTPERIPLIIVSYDIGNDQIWAFNALRTGSGVEDGSTITTLSSCSNVAFEHSPASLHSKTCWYSSGCSDSFEMSITLTLLPSDPKSVLFQISSFLSKTSITPSKIICPVELSFTKYGTLTSTTRVASLETISFTVRPNPAPSLSILLMYATTGILSSLACFQTFSVCASTPATASMIVTAPSKILNDLITSNVKSACPGVSIRLILCLFQGIVTAADWIVIPRSFSWDM